jgi:hypothetical protein
MTAKWDSRPSGARSASASRVAPRWSWSCASSQPACAATSGCARGPVPPRIAASSARGSTSSSSAASAASAPAALGSPALAASRAPSLASTWSCGPTAVIGAAARAAPAVATTAVRKAAAAAPCLVMGGAIIANSSG